MAKFVYEAKTSPKDITKGAIDAENKSAAIRKISQMGYYLLSLEEEGSEILKRSQSGKSYFFNRVSLKDLADFTRQLSDLLEAGIVITQALDILQNQTQNIKLKKIISDIRDFCVGGNSFSNALARHPRVFSSLYVSMVRSGETGGMLENILKRLSDFYDKQLDIQTKIRTALAYPVLMAIVGVVTITILITFVIPKMMVMFTDFGQTLPLPTRILLDMSTIMREYWLIIIGFLAAIVIVMIKIYGTKEGRLVIDRLKLNFPLMGRLIKKVEVASMARTLATLLENGVPILESLKVVIETVENVVIKEDIEKAYTAVKEGSSLANGFGLSRTILPAAINMIAIGEESGHMEKSLLKVAMGYEREADEAIKIMMSLLEPILILTLGIIVGFIVISMLLPIFEINFLVR